MTFDFPRYTPQSAADILSGFDKIGKESAARFAEESARINREYRRAKIQVGIVIGGMTVAAVAGVLYATRNLEA
jgi:hypothetical protein